MKLELGKFCSFQLLLGSSTETYPKSEDWGGVIFFFLSSIVRFKLVGTSIRPLGRKYRLNFHVTLLFSAANFEEGPDIA